VSRNVCNVHSHSDVVEGRIMGAAVVARLHAQPESRVDLEAAKAELNVERAKSAEVTVNCATEAAALAPE
jgi:acid phosphatase (class A)